MRASDDASDERSVVIADGAEALSHAATVIDQTDLHSAAAVDAIAAARRIIHHAVADVARFPLAGRLPAHEMPAVVYVNFANYPRSA